MVRGESIGEDETKSNSGSYLDEENGPPIHFCPRVNTTVNHRLHKHC